MSNSNDFIIENGVLKQYIGPGGDVVIPTGVTSIGYGAFDDCSALKSVMIPTGVTSIGGWAFRDCSALKSVMIPAGVTSIGDEAFAECDSLESVVIPEGVTSIGDGAFDGCSALKSVMIPTGVTSIDYAAFSDCSGLETVTIPDGVTSIGDEAFRGCSALKSVMIPAGVTSIGDEVFRGCNGLADRNGFVIVKGILFDYTGPGGDVVIPAGVTSIEGRAFWGCSALESVTIPSGVTSIGDEVFWYCSALESVTIPSGVTSIGGRAFSNCIKLRWVKSSLPLDSSAAPGCSFPLQLSGERPRWRAFSAKSDRDNLSDFAKPGSWGQYDLELINNGPAYKYKLPARLVGALGRLLDPVELTDENRALYAELLRKNAKKLILLAEEMGEVKLAEDLLSLGVLDEKTVKALRKLMAASSNPEIAALASAAIQTAAPAPEKKAVNAPASPLQAEYAEKLRAIKGDAIIKKMRLIGTGAPAVKLKDGSDAPEELFRFLLASYGGQLYDEEPHRFAPAADEAAKLLAYDSLCEAMDAVSGHLDGPNYPAVLPLLCRFGNARQIRALTDAWKGWSDWSRYRQKGRNARGVLLRAMKLSDTREAVLWLEKQGALAGYAALRGVTTAEIYDHFLFDFKLDENGKRVMDLGVTAVEVALTPELRFALRDTAKNKTIKSIPKKGIDPAIQKKAADELADMRQTLKKAAKIKLGQLFEDYLDTAEFPAESWKKNYLNNAFLRTTASMLVWSQGGRCFILSDVGPVDSAGNAYTITDLPIRLAHPMEMKMTDVAAWQKYFTARGLKQPFAQVWEPVIDPQMVREDRYKGCRINPVYLKNQQKRGIEAKWYETEYYRSKYVNIEGFSVSAQDAEHRDSDEREYLEITEIRPDAWDRRANMVISFLDRITVWGRVRKDDVSVMEQMDRFTLAQITEFIRTAQEAGATNVLAALLEYQNTRFADFDPMDEFTLEW